MHLPGCVLQSLLMQTTHLNLAAQKFNNITYTVRYRARLTGEMRSVTKTTMIQAEWLCDYLERKGCIVEGPISLSKELVIA